MSVTPEQAHATLTWVMDQMRAALAKDKYAPEDLNGYCGFTQSFIDVTCKDYNIGISRPFALHSLPRGFRAAHVALTVEMETTEGNTLYLFDPTFRQFEQSDPGQILANLPGGEAMIDDLYDKGFTELTPSHATIYLTAFSGGICPFETEEEVMEFFTAPPTSTMNNWFPRETLRQQGFLPTKKPAV